MDNGVFKNKLIRAQSLKYEKIDFFNAKRFIREKRGNKISRNLTVIEKSLFGIYEFLLYGQDPEPH